jgi:hypothetical protein
MLNISMWSRPLREEVAALKLLLARFGDSLDQSEACTSSGLGLAPVQASFPLDSIEENSSVVEEEHVYGCISPRGCPNPSQQPDVSVASGSKGMDGNSDRVQQTTPDLPLIVEHVKVDVPTTLSLPEQSNVSPTPIPPSPPHSSDPLVTKEICDLLSRLDVLIPGLGRSIACLLTGTPIKEKIKKVGAGLRTGIRKEKSLGYNKSVNTGKTTAAT